MPKIPEPEVRVISTKAVVIKAVALDMGKVLGKVVCRPMVRPMARMPMSCGGIQIISLRRDQPGPLDHYVHWSDGA